ncbi:MAG: hypothetical protein JWO86_7828, partial [Myxococcaceae bacterium]|nr:hypothetical protein [Myxococcaceae bacterium]
MSLRRFAIAGSFALGAIALASCGSRTGLFGVDGAIANLPDGAALPDGFVPPDSGVDGKVPCMPGRFNFELALAQLMFVIDRSGSMAFSLDGQQPRMGNLPPGVLSRWDTLRDALFQTITPFDNELAMGAKFFPEVNSGGAAPADEACRTDVGVPIAPARGNVNQIINVFDTTDPNGGTPTAEALRLAAQYISGTRGVARTMILATDGAPNCNGDLDQSRCICTSVSGNCATAQGGEFNCLDDIRSINAITDIFQNQKIPVYVIGIGSTERPEFLKVLDDMAVAGGRPRPTAPRHYNVQSGAELQAALTSIGDSIAKCTYLTPSAPTDPNAISVEINGKSIPRDPTHMNGWDWVDQAFGELAFFGPA